MHTFYEQLCRLEIIILEKIELREDMAEVNKVSWRGVEAYSSQSLFVQEVGETKVGLGRATEEERFKTKL